MDAVVELLRGASRPLFVWGAGMRPYATSSLALARSLGVPVACTWGAIDLINHDDPLACGGFGTHGTRAANLAIQSSDLLIALGCRLDTKATGTPSDFAPKARIVMVDIDQAEIDKMPKVGREVIGICADAGEFLNAISFEKIVPTDGGCIGWRTKTQKWKADNIPQGPAYDLMRRISEYTTAQDIIVSDTGNTLGWIMQGFPFKGERFIHAFNFTPMGYGLAGAIGAAFAGGGRRVVAIVGDGGALMSVNELATIARHDLNIKIILLNNHMHQMCVATQDQWLDSKYYATTEEGGLGFPDWYLVPSAFKIRRADNFEGLFEDHEPAMCIQEIAKDARLAYQVKYGDKLA